MVSGRNVAAWYREGGAEFPASRRTGQLHHRELVH